MQERVEIICLKYKEPEVEWKLAKSILENTNYPFKLVFYDTRYGEQNQAKIWNKLVKESSCQYILIIDNDTEVFSNWLEPMIEVFKVKDDVATVVPRTNCGMNVLQMNCKENDGILETGESGLPSGFCNLYKKSIFEEVGYFDEDFYFNGVDTEWFQRANLMGFKSYIQPKAFVYHVGSYSTNKALERGNWTKKRLEEDMIMATKLFNEKFKV